MSTRTLERPDLAPGPVETEHWLITVFDNDVNTYPQVIAILMIATRCSREEAEMEAWEIDHLGKSVVHRDSEDECQRISQIIARIGIRVEVTKE